VSQSVRAMPGVYLQINEPLPFNVPNNNVLHINRSLLQQGKVDVCSIIVFLNALRSTSTERKKTKRKNVPNQNSLRSSSRREKRLRKTFHVYKTTKKIFLNVSSLYGSSP
jgi:hypothetical protein